jgi:hypothetical protein
MTNSKFNPKTSTSPLPEGIKESDLKYPSYKSKDRMVADAGNYGSLTFYETSAFGWCLATLKISSSRRGQRTTDRTYAVRVSDGAQVRVGAGPHVTRTITVYVRESRKVALKKYIEMFQQGQVDANTTRDRISSRRAEGALRRGRGESYWRWNV